MKKLLLLLLLGLLRAGVAAAHGGEDHDASRAATPAGATSFSVAALTERFEVLLRYEPLEGGRPADLRLFLSDYATNAPIRGAKLTLTNPEDATLKWAVTEKGPGEYLVEGQFPANKTYGFTVHIVAGEQADLLLLEGIGVGEKLPVAAGPVVATPSVFSSWKTMLALVGAFVLGIGLTAVLLRRRPAPSTATAKPVAYENQA